MTDYYVYLRLGASKEDDVLVNTVPLRATSVSISTTKTVPSFDVPLSGLFSGESRTLAFNMGMASKAISVQGFITDMSIIRKFEETEPRHYDSSVEDPDDSTLTRSQMSPALPSSSNEMTVEMTKEEIAQLIHSNTDGTTAQTFQNMNELIVLIDSKVDSRYQYRDKTNRTSSLIPFTYSARGARNRLDNRGALLFLSDFPDSSTATGLKGFVRSFSCDFSAEEPSEISFQLEFEVATTV